MVQSMPTTMSRNSCLDLNCSSRFLAHWLEVSIALQMNSMKSWKTPTPEQVEKAIALIVHPQQSSYFFNHLQNPKWISPLKKRDVFKNPPQAIRDSSEGTVSFPAWVESSYLARMAQHEPKAVLEIAIHTETENPRIHRDFVEAALQMPSEEAVKMVAKVKT